MGFSPPSIALASVMLTPSYAAASRPGGTLQPYRTLGWLPVVLELNVDVLLAWSRVLYHLVL